MPFYSLNVGGHDFRPQIIARRRVPVTIRICDPVGQDLALQFKA